MTSQSTFVKVIFIWLAISIMLVMGGVSFTDQIGGEAYGTFITTTGGTNGTWDPTEDQQYTLGTGIQNSAPQVNEQSTFSTGVNFIDAIRAVRTFINLIIDVVFAIPTLFFALPSMVQLMVGIPLGIAGFIGLLYFVRSGQ